MPNTIDIIIDLPSVDAALAGYVTNTVTVVPNVLTALLLLLDEKIVVRVRVGPEVA